MPAKGKRVARSPLQGNRKKKFIVKNQPLEGLDGRADSEDDAHEPIKTNPSIEQTSEFEARASLLATLGKGGRSSLHIPFNKFEDYLLRKVLMRVDRYKKGRGDSLFVKAFWLDFFPVWKIHARKHSHLQDRLKILSQKGARSNIYMSSLALGWMEKIHEDMEEFDSFKAEVDSLFDLDDESEISSESIIQRLAKMMPDFYAYAKQQNREKKAAEMAAAASAKKSAENRKGEGGRFAAESPTSLVLGGLVASKWEKPQSHSTGESPPAGGDEEVEKRVRVTSNRALASASKNATPLTLSSSSSKQQMGTNPPTFLPDPASSSRSPRFSGNVSGQATSLYTVYISIKVGESSSLVQEGPATQIAKPFAGSTLVSDFFKAICPVLVPDDDFLIRFTATPAAQRWKNAAMKPVKADRTWASYNVKPYREVTKFEPPYTTTWSFRAIVGSSKNTFTIDDMGFPSTVYLVLQKIDKRTSTRMRAEKYTCHPVRWVGGGQINNAIEDDEEDDEEE